MCFGFGCQQTHMFSGSDVNKPCFGTFRNCVAMATETFEGPRKKNMEGSRNIDVWCEHGLNPENRGMVKIAVVGAGVVGLSTALNIQEKIPSASVTIIADRFYQDTTSFGAAGIFRPTREKNPGVPLQTHMQWIRDSWDHYHQQAHSAHAQDTGSLVISGYIFYNDSTETHLYRDICYKFRECTKEELNIFPGPKFKHGIFCTTLLTQCRYYMPYLMKQLERNGVCIEKRTVQSFKEFVGEYDLVVNCTGLGSRTLLQDDNITAMRGQIYTVDAPWMKHFIFGGSTYIVPLRQGVVVGGTKQLGNFSLEHSEDDAQTIMDNAVKIVPSIKNAPVLWEWVGLRPHRIPTRVELEVMTFGNNHLKVVHNYGHGAEGVTLSWGTAVHAARLVQEALQGSDGGLAKL